MKYSLLMAVTLLAWALPAAAQDRLELYADQNRSSCSIVEPLSPPIVQVFVFITGPVNATGVRFKAPKPACWEGATWLGDMVPGGYGAIGNSQTDWSIGFGSCISTTPAGYVGAISYLISGRALSCCVVNALPAIQFAFADCIDFTEHDLQPSRPLIVNPDASCACQPAVVTATEPTTWGHVKSLYR